MTSQLSQNCYWAQNRRSDHNRTLSLVSRQQLVVFRRKINKLVQLNVPLKVCVNTLNKFWSGGADLHNKRHFTATAPPADASPCTEPALSCKVPQERQNRRSGGGGGLLNMSERKQGRHARLCSYLDTWADIIQLIIIQFRLEWTQSQRHLLTVEKDSLWQFTQINLNLRGTNQIALYFSTLRFVYLRSRVTTQKESKIWDYL